MPDTNLFGYAPSPCGLHSNMKLVFDGITGPPLYSWLTDAMSGGVGAAAVAAGAAAAAELRSGSYETTLWFGSCLIIAEALDAAVAATTSAAARTTIISLRR